MALPQQAQADTGAPHCPPSCSKAQKFLVVQTAVAAGLFLLTGFSGVIIRLLNKTDVDMKTLVSNQDEVTRN